MPHKGYFVIADITGYTAFLTASELEHAQDVLKTLFNTLLDNIKPPLLVSNYQGDAILTYAPDGTFIQGQTLLETVENIYCGFAYTREHMRHNTTCTCRACANIPNLDLKLFIHHGEYVTQDLRGKQELSGPDVIVVHRMMKNEVRERTGLKAYALFTERAIEALGLGDYTSEMMAHSESYEHIGDVGMYVHDLGKVWEREREQRRTYVEPEHAWFVVESEIPAPPALVWDYLNKPEMKHHWMAVDGVTASKLHRGRMGVGTVHHCAHGEGITDFTIADWRPFEYVTLDSSTLMMGFPVRSTARLTPIEGGTRIAIIYGKPDVSGGLRGLVGRLALPVLKKLYQPEIQRCGERLCQMIEDDLAAGKVVVQSQAGGTPSSTARAVGP